MDRSSRLALFVLVVVAASVGRCGSALAQNDGLHISLHRVVGYSLGSQVQGTFELRAEDGPELAFVAYTIDGTVLGESSKPPFAIRLSTDDYSPGWRELRAEGRTGDGRTLGSDVLRVEIVSRRAIWTVVRRIGVPGGFVLGAIALIALVLSLVAARRRRTQRLVGRVDLPDRGPPIAPRAASRALTPDEEMRRRIEDSRYTEL